MSALTLAQFSMWYRRADAGDLGRIRDGRLVAQETEVRVATPTCSPPVPPTVAHLPDPLFLSSGTVLGVVVFLLP